MIRRILVLIWFLALVVLLSACSLNEDPHDNVAASSSENVLRIDVNHDFGPFNPYTMECSGSTYVFPFIYSALFIPNPDGELEPDLAADWDYNAQTFTWQI